MNYVLIGICLTKITTKIAFSHSETLSKARIKSPQYFTFHPSKLEEVVPDLTDTSPLSDQPDTYIHPSKVSLDSQHRPHVHPVPLLGTCA